MGLVLNLDKEKFSEWCREKIVSLMSADLCYKYLLEDHVNYIKKQDSESTYEKDKLLDKPLWV